MVLMVGWEMNAPNDSRKSAVGGRKSVFPITGRQVRGARAMLEMSIEELAEAAQVGVQTVRRFELGESEPKVGTLVAIQRALEKRGAEFGEPNWVNVNE